MKKSVIALLHLGFWIVYLILMMVIMYVITESSGITKDISEEETARMFFSMILLPAIFTFYLFYFFLFPRFFKKKRYLFSLLIGAGIAASTTLLGYFSVSDLFVVTTEQANQPTSWQLLFFSFLNLLCGIVAFVIRGFSNWFEEVKLKEALLQKNHEMELNLVKSQLDPHFLFNTINNIDVLILKDATEASNYLNQLSDIMRFMLFETKTDEIALTKELAYIEKYIALQKIRTANKEYVSLSISGDPEGKNIAPMVFIPFIENAFKHTTNKKTANAISITIEVEEDALNLLCINKFDSNRIQKKDSNGIGNELIVKRLNLLYPETHTLSVTKANDQYRVHLKIEHAT